MSWPEAFVAITVTLVGLGVLAAFFLLLDRAVHKAGGGLAGEWALRCTRCGQTRGATEAGLVRIGAMSVGKYTLGYCSACGERLRVIAIQRSSPPPEDAAAPAAPLHVDS